MMYLILLLFCLLKPPLLIEASPGKGGGRTKPLYVQLALNATEFPAEDEYDYIVVGGGTAGCPLAATLSANPNSLRVLLLERGSDPLSYPALSSPRGFFSTLNEDNSPDSPAQRFESEDGVPNARGRVLGGSSAINAGFYTRAEPDFFAPGKPGYWDMGLVNRSYQWVERAVLFQPRLTTWQADFRDALLEANVTPFNGFRLDHVEGTKIGGSTFDGTRRRHSAADLLNYARPENIHVALHATVEKVLFTSVQGTGVPRPTAIGVVYADLQGRPHHAMLLPRGEVILSAGAIGSPQLLMLSGIGSNRSLIRWGIPVAHHLPAVGNTMRDNPRNALSFVSPVRLPLSLIQVVAITPNVFLEAASNLLPFSPRSRSLFLSPRYSSIPLNIASLMAKIPGPLSSGSLRLASSNVRDNPLVTFNYFDEGLDLQRCMEGVRLVARVLGTSAMDQFKFPGRHFGEREFWYLDDVRLPANLSNDDAVAEFCHRTVSTIWHYHGGCVMGEVVDTQYRVFGVQALRVVDGSTFSHSPGTNPQATVMMLGRYVGVKMLEERRASDRDTKIRA
ncbi:hypothetical protein AMTRI_Chr01g135830 [Amborella trichopoda]